MKIQNDHQTTAKSNLVGEEGETSKFITKGRLKLDWQLFFPYDNSNYSQNTSLL